MAERAHIAESLAGAGQAGEQGFIVIGVCSVEANVICCCPKAAATALAFIEGSATDTEAKADKVIDALAAGALVVIILTDFFARAVDGIVEAVEFVDAVEAGGALQNRFVDDAALVLLRKSGASRAGAGCEIKTCAAILAEEVLVANTGAAAAKGTGVCRPAILIGHTLIGVGLRSSDAAIWIGARAEVVAFTVVIPTELCANVLFWFGLGSGDVGNSHASAAIASFEAGNANAVAVLHLGVLRTRSGRHRGDHAGPCGIVFEAVVTNANAVDVRGVNLTFHLGCGAALTKIV